FDAWKSGENLISKEGYSLDKYDASAFVIDDSYRNPIQWFTGSAPKASDGKRNSFFHYTADVSKGGEKFRLNCWGYISRFWNPLLKATATDKNPSLGSDCVVQRSHWYGWEDIALPKGETGKGQLSLSFNEDNYKNKVTANANYP